MQIYRDEFIPLNNQTNTQSYSKHLIFYYSEQLDSFKLQLGFSIARMQIEFGQQEIVKLVSADYRTFTCSC